MRDMQVLGILLGTLAVAAAQFPQRFSNPGFRNVRTPLSPSASKDKPYLSIPIVLMPDGKIVPKPAQISYQYMPPAQNGNQQSSQRGPKVGRDSSLPSSNYQVVAPPSSYSPPQPKRKKTVPQNGMYGSSGTRRPSGSNIPKNNKNQPPQQQQQNQNVKYMQQQNMQTVSYMHTQNQRNPPNQQQVIANQPNNEAYKQNVLNFINFASNLGAQMTSQQAQKPQMQSTDAMYGMPEPQKSYENHAYQSPSSGQSQTDINMYLQSQAQSNSAQQTHQVQQQAAQPTNYNLPQVQNQVMAAPMNYQYGQSNRPQIQGGQQQSSVQNQATVFQQNFGNAVQFPGNHNNPVSTNSYSQASQQTLPQNYVIVSSPQESTANARPLTNVNFDPQSQMMKNIFTTQPQMETPSYDVNAQIKHQNFGNQNQEGQTYITPDGQQISFVNTAQHSPVTYSIQQNVQQPQQIDNQNVSPTVQTSYGQPGEQKVYVSYQNPQDLSTSYAQSNTATQAGQQNEQQTQYRNIQPQTLVTSVQNPYAGQQQVGQQVAYRVQSQASSGSQSPESVSAYSYVNEQPSYLPTGQKQDSSSSGGGKLIYATSSAKQIHYSSSGQGYAIPQSKNNEELSSSPYAQFSDSSSSYKFDSDDDDDSAEYTKQSPSGQLADKQQAKEDDDDDSEEGDEETSYKVVYIPLDILKNILNNNSVENQRSDKAS